LVVDANLESKEREIAKVNAEFVGFCTIRNASLSGCSERKPDIHVRRKTRNSHSVNKTIPKNRTFMSGFLAPVHVRGLPALLTLMLHSPPFCERMLGNPEASGGGSW
jgi:hypothetical protein